MPWYLILIYIVVFPCAVITIWINVAVWVTILQLRNADHSFAHNPWRKWRGSRGERFMRRYR